MRNLETPATSSTAPRASAIHRILRRKRPYVVPTVFVVDDEHVIASTLATILKLHGYCATSFTSALEALAAAQSSAPDLLISDVVMPGLSGVDLAIQIKAECPACKILLFSGQASTQDLLEDARRQGYHFELLQKPVHPSTMLASIRALSEAGPIPVPPASQRSAEALKHCECLP
jgi:DNA-binding NtrC family response regulator